MKDVILGGGAVGSALYQIIKNEVYYVFDLDIKKCKHIVGRHLIKSVRFLHVCIPYEDGFNGIVARWAELVDPTVIVIHSTVEPLTGMTLQSTTGKTVISSPIRGKHDNLVNDMRKYTKWYGFQDNKEYRQYSCEFNDLFWKNDVTVQKKSSGLVCELAKLYVDTTYAGYLINYAQMTKEVFDRYGGIDYDEVWQYSDEMADRKPKYKPNKIEGHCIIQNLKLADSLFLSIQIINERFKN